jgi:hypothetical protein
MPNEYNIAVLLPTRSRTDALTASVTSIIDLADNISHLQLIFGFDDDDTVGLGHFRTVIQPFLDKHGVSYEAQAFQSLGYAGLIDIIITWQNQPQQIGCLYGMMML